MNLSRIYARNEAMWNKVWVISPAKEIEMMKEEYNEYRKALAEWNKIEVIDGLLDMVFVYGGTLYKAWVEKERAESLVWSIMPTKQLIDLYTSSLYLKAYYHVADEYSNIMASSYYVLRELYDLKPSQVDLLFEEICRSNDTKEPQEHDGLTKIRKWPNYSPPDLQGVLDSFVS